MLEDAAHALDIRPPDNHHFDKYSGGFARVAFYTPDDDDGVKRDFWQLGEVAVVDPDGRVVLGVHDNRIVTIAQLVRSADAGVLKGDPLRPFLIVETPYGDAPPIDLPTFRAALDVLWDAVTIVSTAGGALPSASSCLTPYGNVLRLAVVASRPDGPTFL